MRRLFKFKYPKLLVLAIFIILSYLLFSNEDVQNFVLGLGNLSYIGVFLAGILLAFGFTAPFAVGFFIISDYPLIFIAAVLGALGAMVGDLIIFRFIRSYFMDEFIRLEHTKEVKKITELIKKEFSHKARIYLIYAFAGIAISSPLPDELGLVMLAGLTKINGFLLGKISFVLHFIGILIILVASR